MFRDKDEAQYHCCGHWKCVFRDIKRLNITAVDIGSACSEIGRGSISLLWTLEVRVQR